MQEISWNDLMFRAPRGIRELKLGLGCPLVVPTSPGEQNPTGAGSADCHGHPQTGTWPHQPGAASFPAASPKFLTAHLTWPFAPVRMIIPMQIHDLLCYDL